MGYDEQRRRENEADLPRRLEFLTTERTAAVIDLIERARPFAERHPKSQPCDYAPWATALGRVEPLGEDWPRFDRHHAVSAAEDVSLFACDVSRPGWPDGHGHLVDFALTFLEADVMLFRSGYTKRHLVVRLRQARLSPDQHERARHLLERAVLNGAGLEEFREFCRLAAKVAPGDRLHDWLVGMAGEAMLTLNAVDNPDWRRASRRFDEPTFRKLQRVDRMYRRVWAFPADFTPRLVKSADLPDRNRAHLNAWRMLRRIERIWAAKPQ